MIFNNAETLMLDGYTSNVKTTICSCTKICQRAIGSRDELLINYLIDCSGSEITYIMKVRVINVKSFL